jgi:hypothetical protein
MEFKTNNLILVNSSLLLEFGLSLSSIQDSKANVFSSKQVHDSGLKPVGIRVTKANWEIIF